jgi:hypothetical protein
MWSQRENRSVPRKSLDTRGKKSRTMAFLSPSLSLNLLKGGAATYTGDGS